MREILAICADWPVDWITEAAWPEVKETDAGYEENALLKAGTAASATGEAALGEDSGIEVDALGGAPGPRSARYAGDAPTDEANLEALLGALSRVPDSDRTARYRAVAVVVWPDGRSVTAEGVCEGILKTEPEGAGGFGYDPIFQPLDQDRTMAQLEPEEKNAISHRGRALRALRDLVGGGV